MSNARSSARPRAAASVVRRRTGLVAVSVAGALAGLAAATAGGVRAAPTVHGRSPGSSSTSASAGAVARASGLASSDVAWVLAPAPAGVERPGWQEPAP